MTTAPEELARLRARVPEAARNLLDGKDGRYSEWATACAIATYAMNADLTEGEYVTLVSESAFADEFATENGRDRSARLENRLRKAWEKVEDFWMPPFGDIEMVRAKLAELSNRVDEHVRTGRTANTDRVVALALVAWAHEIGTWVVGAGARDLAERAGVGSGTASRALKRLAGMGLIRPEEGSRQLGHSKRWTINMDWAPDGVPTTKGHVEGQTGSHVPDIGGKSTYVPLCHSGTGHPAFLGSALGRTAERLWLDLSENGEATVADLADRLGMNRRTVRRNLEDRLVANHLVVKSEGSPSAYSVASGVDTDALDRIAEACGTLDWDERTADRHERERTGHAELLRQRATPTPEPEPALETEPVDDRRRVEEEMAYAYA